MPVINGAFYHMDDIDTPILVRTDAMDDVYSLLWKIVIASEMYMPSQAKAIILLFSDPNEEPIYEAVVRTYPGKEPVLIKEHGSISSYINVRFFAIQA